MVTEPLPAQQGEDGGISTGYGATSVSAGMLNVITIPLNAAAAPEGKGPRWHGPVGLVSGGAGIALGVARLGDESGSVKALAITNIGVGALAAILGLTNLLSSPTDREPSDVWSGDQGPSLGSTARVEPMLGVAPDGTPVVGLRVGFN